MKTILIRKEYVKALTAVLSAKEDFNSLEYYRNPTTAEEYLILSDIIGNVAMLNITGKSEANILHSIALIETGKVPSNLISDRAEMMQIALLRK